MKQAAIIILFAFFTCNVFAQNQDCDTALELTSKESISYSSTSGIGQKNEYIQNDCAPNDGSFENSSKWFKFTVYQSGNLFFTITPDLPQDDIDFFLYRTDSGGCSDFTSVRCNATSCNENNGKTGLSENEIDLFEDLNCDNGENAFSKDIDISESETYYLIVNNWTNSGAGYRIDFCGTALLGESDDVCNEITSAKEITYQEDINVYPNPTNGLLHIDQYQEIHSLEIINLAGEILSTKLVNSPLINIDVPTGFYVARLVMNNGNSINKSIIVTD